MKPEKSPKSYTVALLLCIFLGCLGVHRFYVGRNLSGLLMLVTFGLFGIWTMVDFIILAFGCFRDSNDLKIRW